MQMEQPPCQSGFLGFTLCDTHTGVLTRESSITTGVENQPVRDSFQMPRNAERLQACFIKVIENRNYSEQRIRACTELPHIYYLSLDSVGTKLLRVCVHSPASSGSACACERSTYSTRVQTPFNNPQAGRMRLGPNDASPRFSDLLRATTGNRGRLHT